MGDRDRWGNRENGRGTKVERERCGREVWEREKGG